MRTDALATAAAGVLAALVLGACSGGDSERPATAAPPPTTPDAARSNTATGPQADASPGADASPDADAAPEPDASPDADPPPPADRPRLRRARCPASAPAGCRSASGSVVYVERVDPDGDGDAHFVLASDDSITAPGISVIDVRKDLRPHPLPGPGDRISAAGPVYRGSYGQHQIEAVVLHVLR